jgi:hypothetical protein
MPPHLRVTQGPALPACILIVRGDRGAEVALMVVDHKQRVCARLLRMPGFLQEEARPRQASAVLCSAGGGTTAATGALSSTQGPPPATGLMPVRLAHHAPLYAQC